MRTSRRRRLDAAIMGAGVLGVGAVAFAGAFVGKQEQIDRYWTSAGVNDDGSAQITEVIDYQFSVAGDNHGIFRDVPGLPADAPISVSSPDAPDAFEVIPRPGETRLKIGRADTTVSGKKRYQINYRLPDVQRGNQIDWEAVGTEWEVPIDEAEIHLAAPYELGDVGCFQGRAGSTATCEIEQPEPGHLVATVTDLSAGQGVSIEAKTLRSLPSAPALPEPPTSRPDDAGTGLLPPAGTAAAAALIAAAPATLVLRRAGRERVAAGGSADAAYAGQPGLGQSPAGEIRVDEADLGKMATTEFAPPAELTPPQGGVVLVEKVQPEHKVAWLIQASIDGAIDMQEEDRRRVHLTRTGPGTAESAPVLDAAFYGRSELTLGSYDKHFASAWSSLDGRLSHWRDSSGLWDAAADRRRITTRVLGALALVAGLIATGVGGALANARGPGWLVLAALGGLVAGVSGAAVIGAWELHVRTPLGSGLWLRVESFRRFLAGSEAYHAEEAAKRGVLREYTAWALALGEIDRWSWAVSSSTIIPQDAGLGYIYMAPLLMSSTRVAATAPSSSGSGGGFGGGGVGGGAGGGGGGSW